MNVSKEIIDTLVPASPARHYQYLRSLRSSLPTFIPWSFVEDIINPLAQATPFGDAFTGLYHAVRYYQATLWTWIPTDSAANRIISELTDPCEADVALFLEQAGVAPPAFSERDRTAQFLVRHNMESIFERDDRCIADIVIPQDRQASDTILASVMKEFAEGFAEYFLPRRGIRPGTSVLSSFEADITGELDPQKPAYVAGTVQSFARSGSTVLSVSAYQAGKRVAQAAVNTKLAFDQTVSASAAAI